MATQQEAQQTLNAAQAALHSIYGRDKPTATKLYNDLETWARTGHKPLIGSRPAPVGSLLEANAILIGLTAKGGQDATDAKAILLVLQLPASQVIGLGGFAPASVNPKSVSKSFATSAKAAVGSLNPLGGLFQSNLWLRVAEVVIGVLLLGVGIAKLTNAVPIATKLAKTLA
jgi:hypothetical protein